MTAGSTRTGWRILAGACALAAGLWIGHWNRDLSSVGMGTTAGKKRGSTSQRQNFSDSDSTASAPRKTKQVNDTSLAFSKQQWAKLVESPRLLAISLDEGQVEVPVINDVPVVGRLFEAEAKGPFFNLKTHADFFGWDDQQLEKVRRAFISFSLDLQDAEASGTTIDYPKSGGILVDYSSSQAQRERLVANLKTDLVSTIGMEDSRKLFLLSGMEGLATELKPKTLVIPNAYKENSGSTASPGDPSISRMPIDRILTETRFSHLGIEIDWNRVRPEAKTSGTTSR